MKLDDKSFELFAAKNYDFQKSMSVDEFHSDLKRFKYVRRLLKRYDVHGELKTRLILNHLTVIFNCFGPNASHMLFLRMDEYQSTLKPFLVFLNFLPEKVHYKGKIVNTVNIPMDEYVIEELRKI